MTDHTYVDEGRGNAICSCRKWAVRLSDLSTDDDRASTFAYRKWERHVKEHTAPAPVYDLTTPEGRLDILIRETFPWSTEASTMACQTIRGLLAERDKETARLKQIMAILESAQEAGLDVALVPKEENPLAAIYRVFYDAPGENPNAGLEAWADRYMTERGIEPTPEGQSLADRVARGEA